ncbi:hypothetical protein HDU67_007561 [Dinochytrium kinnereticum]|nr:hypothetical protein HDU67_007561 [Dinochytrium kinnereticum]
MHYHRRPFPMQSLLGRPQGDPSILTKNIMVLLKRLHPPHPDHIPSQQVLSNDLKHHKNSQYTLAANGSKVSKPSDHVHESTSSPHYRNSFSGSLPCIAVPSPVNGKIEWDDLKWESDSLPISPRTTSLIDSRVRSGEALEEESFIEFHRHRDRNHFASSELLPSVSSSTAALSVPFGTPLPMERKDDKDGENLYFHPSATSSEHRQAEKNVATQRENRLRTLRSHSAISTVDRLKSYTFPILVPHNSLTPELASVTDICDITRAADTGSNILESLSRSPGVENTPVAATTEGWSSYADPKLALDFSWKEACSPGWELPQLRRGRSISASTAVLSTQTQSEQARSSRDEDRIGLMSTASHETAMPFNLHGYASLCHVLTFILRHRSGNNCMDTAGPRDTYVDITKCMRAIRFNAFNEQFNITCSAPFILSLSI